LRLSSVTHAFAKAGLAIRSGIATTLSGDAAKMVAISPE